MRLDRAANQVLVRDAWSLKASGGRVAYSLMTPCDVTISGPGEIALAGGLLNRTGVRLLFDRGLRATVETLKTEDARLKPVWGSQIRRILLSAENLPAKGEHLLRINA
jgi:hypothetical protein